MAQQTENQIESTVDDKVELIKTTNRLTVNFVVDNSDGSIKELTIDVVYVDERGEDNLDDREMIEFWLPSAWSEGDPPSLAHTLEDAYGMLCDHLDDLRFTKEQIKFVFEQLDKELQERDLEAIGPFEE
tara:strand:- start:421 stop:807 length:387 start_codon:yes stop_codon:yes gene_type:complete